MADGCEREPEREDFKFLKKWKDSSSGEKGNLAGRTRGEPKVASAGEKPVFSCGVDLKEKRNQGRWLTQFGMAQRARNVSLRRR